MRGPALALGLVSLVVSLLMAELVLRLVDLPFRSEWTPSEFAIAKFDPVLGWAYDPGRSVTQEFGQPPRRVELHFDSHGARVASPGRENREGEKSILLVGDSFTMGHGLPYEETFAGRLEKMQPLQVVNLGVQAFGTDQALLRLRQNMGRFQIEAVVLTFIGEHVLRNAVEDRRLLHPTARFRGTKPLFALKDGQVVQIHQPTPYEEYRYWRLVAMARSLRYRRGPAPDPALTRALIQTMDGEVRSRGGTLLVVNWEQPAYPSRPDVFRDLDVRWIEPHQGAPDGWDEWIIPGDGHPDARAHAHVAARIMDALRAQEGLADHPALSRPRQ